jgi:hypothetical protein
MGRRKMQVELSFDFYLQQSLGEDWPLFLKKKFIWRTQR